MAAVWALGGQHTAKKPEQGLPSLPQCLSHPTTVVNLTITTMQLTLDLLSPAKP